MYWLSGYLATEVSFFAEISLTWNKILQIGGLVDMLYEMNIPIFQTDHNAT